MQGEWCAHSLGIMVEWCAHSHSYHPLPRGEVSLDITGEAIKDQRNRTSVERTSVTKGKKIIKQVISKAVVLYCSKHDVINRPEVQSGKPTNTSHQMSQGTQLTDPDISQVAAPHKRARNAKRKVVEHHRASLAARSADKIGKKGHDGELTPAGEAPSQTVPETQVPGAITTGSLTANRAEGGGKKRYSNGELTNTEAASQQTGPESQGDAPMREEEDSGEEVLTDEEEDEPAGPALPPTWEATIADKALDEADRKHWVKVTAAHKEWQAVGIDPLQLKEDSDIAVAISMTIFAAERGETKLTRESASALLTALSCAKAERQAL